jgi:tRNA dimethylallyltransferase
MRFRLPVLVGATASGKTALALELAKHLPIEVVAADSRTVYRWMDIGTAKPTLDEQWRVPHHLIDVVDPDEPYSIALYQQQALAAVERIRARGKAPLLVGGAGLYVSAVCDGVQLPDVPADDEFRAEREQQDWQTLQGELTRVDPTSAERIDPRNTRRVIRALEVHHVTGVPFSAWQARREERPFEPFLVGLDVERAELYRRIDARIDAWLATGFVDEVRGLLARGYSPALPAMSGLGYREVAAMLRDEMSLEAATTKFKLGTHAYARRQLTWFRRDERVQWLAPGEALARLLNG